MYQAPLMIFVLDSTVNIQQLCRLCGTKTEEHNRLNIFDISNASLNLPCKIKLCLGIEINPIDNLPKVVCVSCLSNLEKFSKFKYICDTTASLLSSLNGQQLMHNNLQSVVNVSYNNPMIMAPMIVNNSPIIVSESSLVEPLNPNQINEVTSAVEGQRILPKPSNSKQMCPTNISLTVSTNSREYFTKETQSESLEPIPKKSTEIKTYQCDICSKIFSNRRFLQVHISRNHLIVDTKFICTICNKKFKFAWSLNYHIKSLHEKRYSYVCDYCGKGFFGKCVFESHIRLKHTNERPFECTICNKKYSANYLLKSHISVDHDDKIYSCDICNESYTNKYKFNAHKKQHTISVEDMKKFKCEICGAGFKKNCSLKYHMRKHTGEQPYECKICNNRFTFLGCLKIHTATHTGERNHVCEICGSTFALPNTLKIHRASVHEGLKMYKCNDCDKSYTQNQNLNIHLRKTGHTKLKKR